MDLSIKAGATSQSVNVFIKNSSVTTDAGLTGLAFNTSNLKAYYSFTGANAAATVIPLVTLAAVNSAWSSGGFKELDATNMPGWYRLDLPNAAIAAGKGREVTLELSGATNMAQTRLTIELTATDNQDAAAGGMSNLDATVSSRLAANAVPNNFNLLLITDAGFLDPANLNVNGVVPGGDGGLMIGGASQTLSLKSLTINNDATDDAAVAIIGHSGTIASMQIINQSGSPGLEIDGLPDVLLGQGQLSANLLGKVLGGLAAPITGVGVRAVDSSGNALATSAQATTIANQTTAAAIAGAVWNALKASYQAVGSFGAWVSGLLIPNITITPVQANIATGQITSTALNAVLNGTMPPLVFNPVDQLGNAVTMIGPVEFRLWRIGSGAPGSEVVVDTIVGVLSNSNRTCTVQVPKADNNFVGTLGWSLWDTGIVGGDEPLATGTYFVSDAGPAP